VLENTWKKICYENIYSQQKSSGVIEKVVEDEVYLSNWKILDLNENVFYLCNE
jgi:ferredoxin-fold anticodon binding domain-containing protein